jgi:periplasmic divalent cation tolerance protein
MDASGIRIFLTTAGTPEQGAAIARGLVEQRLAACVNVVGGVRSFYAWKGELQDEPEVLLLIKTVAGAEEVARAIGALHPYELPEVVAVPAAFVEERFGRWVLEGCGKTA